MNPQIPYLRKRAFTNVLHMYADVGEGKTTALGITESSRLLEVFLWF